MKSKVPFVFGMCLWKSAGSGAGTLDSWAPVIQGATPVADI